VRVLVVEDEASIREVLHADLSAAVTALIWPLTVKKGCTRPPNIRSMSRSSTWDCRSCPVST
jgi:hypothetical protein